MPFGGHDYQRFGGFGSCRYLSTDGDRSTCSRPLDRRPGGTSCAQVAGQIGRGCSFAGMKLDRVHVGGFTAASPFSQAHLQLLEEVSKQKLHPAALHQHICLAGMEALPVPTTSRRPTSRHILQAVCTFASSCASAREITGISTALKSTSPAPQDGASFREL